MRITNTLQDVLQELVEELREAFAVYMRENFSRLRDPADALDREIKVMLGRGEITQEQYEGLNRKLRYGSLGRGDLELLRRQARKRAYKQPGEDSTFHEPAIAAGLDRLYVRISSLDDTRRQAQDAVKRLEEDLKRIRDYADSAQELARRALPDENEARALLEIRQSMAERLHALEARKRSLDQGMRRLDVLQGELYAREAELKALGAEAGLARSEYRGWDGLLNQDKLGLEEHQVQSKSERDQWR